LNEDRPIHAAKKCRPMTLVSENIRYVRILAGVPLGGASNESGVVDDSNFWKCNYRRQILRKRLEAESD